MKKKLPNTFIYIFIFLLSESLMLYFAKYLDLNKWLLLAIAVGVMAINIVLCIITKLYKTKGYWLPIIINGLAMGLAVSAYMKHLNVTLQYWSIIIPFIICILFIVIFYFGMMIPLFAKYELRYTAITLLLALATIVILWVAVDKVIYSQLFFMLLLASCFIIGASVDNVSEKEFYQLMTLCSFGVILVIIIVFLLIITEGEAAGEVIGSGIEGAIDGSTSKKKR